MTEPSQRSKYITRTALFLALGVLLPVAFHMLGVAGRVFLPMHIPVLLAGFLVGPSSGLIVGLLAPILSHLLTGMPPTYAVPLMTAELPMYGLIAGLAYNRLRLNVFVALLIAMLAGRIVFGLSLLCLGMFIDLPYSTAQYFAGGAALLTGLPGIVAQILLVPLIVAAVRRRSGQA